MNNWKWKYFSKTQGDWHHTFTKYFKVKVDEQTGKEIEKPISISYQEYQGK